MFSNPLVRAALAPGALLLGGVLLVAGCGGGGGGGATVPTSTPGPTPTPTATPLPGTVFSDEFNAGSLDTGKWSTLGSDMTLQRTRFGNKPEFGQEKNPDNTFTQFMRVKLDTYLSGANAKQQFFGTEVVAGEKISPPQPGQTIDFQARIRVPNPKQLGLVGAFFAFGSKNTETFGSTPPESFDEIDHELLTNSFNLPQPSTWTNVYNDFRVPQPGVRNGDGDSYADTSRTRGLANKSDPSYTPSTWNVYRILWQPTQVQWFINTTLIRTATPGSDPIPNDPIGVRFNIWAPEDPIKGGWIDAYNSALAPATTPAANQTYSIDVDWVRVRALDSTTSGNARRTSGLRLVPVSPQELRQTGGGR